MGGTKIAVCLVTPVGEIKNLHRIPTNAHKGGKLVMNKVISLARQVIREIENVNETQFPTAIGVSSAWLVYPESGIVTYTYSDAPGWDEISIKNQLENDLGLPTYIDGDAGVMTLGEAYLGSAQNFHHVIGLTVGTGVGGGFVIDGEIYHGSQGFAGNFGHIVIDYLGKRKCPCGRFGCLEAYASGPSIVENFVNRVGKNRIRQEFGFNSLSLGVKDIHKLALNGDGDALSAIKEGAHFLGIGVATLINIFNPDVVVVGGGVAQIGEIYFREVNSTALNQALPFLTRTPIIPAKFRAESNLVGAACLAWQKMGLN